MQGDEEEYLEKRLVRKPTEGNTRCRKGREGRERRGGRGEKRKHETSSACLVISSSELIGCALAQMAFALLQSYLHALWTTRWTQTSRTRQSTEKERSTSTCVCLDFASSQSYQDTCTHAGWMRSRDGKGKDGRECIHDDAELISVRDIVHARVIARVPAHCTTTPTSPTSSSFQ